jgi:hypothetical protein
LFFFTQIQIVFLFFLWGTDKQSFFPVICYYILYSQRKKQAKDYEKKCCHEPAVQVRPNLTRALIKIEQPDHEIDKVIIAPAVNGSTTYNRKNWVDNQKCPFYKVVKMCNGPHHCIPLVDMVKKHIWNVQFGVQMRELCLRENICLGYRNFRSILPVRDRNFRSETGTYGI